MNIPEVLRNEELRRQEFPVAADKIFLAHAGVCPLPRRVTDAIHAYTRLTSIDDQETVFPVSHFSNARDLAARLIGAKAEEIALVGPTSLGLSLVASGFPFRKGDNMLVYFDDFPSNVYPWMTLAERGVQVRFIKARELGCIRPMDVEEQIDEQTRLVALGACHYLSGWRIDISAIGKMLRARGIAFCVDAIQALGAFPVSAENVDFLAADAHKWLLGPCAAGIFFVRKEWQDKLKPTVQGWHNIRCPEYIAQEKLVFRSDARRYEAGTANMLGIAGLEAALQLLVETGIDNIAHELLRKRELIVKALREKGYTVLSADAPPSNGGAIISFFRDGTDPAPLHQKLLAANIVTSLRADRSGRKYIRLSPHFYNSDEELARCLEML